MLLYFFVGLCAPLVYVVFACLSLFRFCVLLFMFSGFDNRYFGIDNRLVWMGAVDSTTITINEIVIRLLDNRAGPAFTITITEIAIDFLLARVIAMVMHSKTWDR